MVEKSETHKEFKDALTGNYVLSELVNLANETPFYWKSGNIAEVDFVIQNDMDIIPIKVKPEQNSKAKSLGEYRKKYAPGIAITTSLKNTAGSSSADIKTVPLYMLWKLKKYIAP
jgi:predicted AAA+ superfamily ATPase